MGQWEEQRFKGLEIGSREGGEEKYSLSANYDYGTLLGIFYMIVTS